MMSMEEILGAPPQEPSSTKNITAGEISKADVAASQLKRYASRPGFAMKTGAALGLANTLLNDDDEGMIGTSMNMAVGAGLGYMADRLADRLYNNRDILKSMFQATDVTLAEKAMTVADFVLTNQEEVESVRKEYERKLTAGKVEKEHIQAKTENHLDDVRVTKKAKKLLSAGKAAGMIGLGAFAVASILDTWDELHQDVRVERQKAIQERNLTRQMNREKRELAKQGYGNIDLGSIVLDMWEERIGHYKMGNAKFQ